MNEQTQQIIQKCEQYWNEHNIGDAEIHVALEIIRTNAFEADDRIEELEAIIVEKLPKTADGVHVGPYDKVYFIIKGGAFAGLRSEKWVDWNCYYTRWPHCYSTRAAAELAKEGVTK